MSRSILFAALSLGSVACAPPDSSQTPVSGAPAVVQGASAFELGPIKSAQAYLEEPVYASADVERGELLSLACIACHTLSPGQDHMLGPNLGGIFGSPAAAKPGFDYSAALSSTGLTWTPPALDAWLAAPASFVPGTSMVFAGYSAPSDRRDLIAYLLRVTQQSAQ
jgi:cytochrome c